MLESAFDLDQLDNAQGNLPQPCDVDMKDCA